MGFNVEPGDLDGFSSLVKRASEDAEQAHAYVSNHAQIGGGEQGLFTRLFDLHGSLQQDVGGVLKHLQTILTSSSGELSRSATYYRDTDTGQAAKLDATYPASKR